MAKPAAKTLHRAMKSVMARAEERSLGYATTLGEPALRRQIAYHYFDTIGAQAEPEQIVITNGGQVIRTRVSEIRETGRNTQGVTLITLGDDQRLVGVEKIVQLAGDDDDDGEAPAGAADVENTD